MTLQHLTKLNVLGLTLFALLSAAGCAQLLGDVEVCTEQPGKPCPGATTDVPNPNLPNDNGIDLGGGGFGSDIIPAAPPEPCTEQDALRCNGPEFQRCSQAVQGLGWLTLQACRTDALCMSGEADQVAGCRLAACSAGQYTCNGAVLQTCSDDLTSYVVADVCLSAAHCDKDTGACKEVPCQPGETRCNDRALERCSDDQTGWVPQTETPCESLELCELTRQQAATTCQAPACEAGAVLCDGSTILQCNAGRTAMEPIADCLTAALCANSVAAAVPGATVTCLPPACDVGEYRCDSANLLVCNADRTGLVVERTCAGAPFCNAAMAEQGLPLGSPGCVDTPCDPGQTSCNGAQPVVCSPDLTGFTPSGAPCASRDLCVDDVPNQPASCRPPACLRGPGTNEYRCNGAQLQQCNTQLTGYDTIATCASAGLCGPRANGCSAPVCNAGQRRCNPANGSVEVCNAQLTGFVVESNCGGNGCRQGPPPVCNNCVPGSPASCTNGDIVTCNGGVAGNTDCGAAGCRATAQGPLCNACTPGAPPACTGGDIVTCTGGVPQLQDCGAAGCRVPTAGAPLCNDCVPGSVPTCTNGDIVACAAGATVINDCGAPGCRVTQQGPVCNQCVPNSPATCSNGDLVACNANGTPVITDCGGPGCRNTPQGPQCNQCAVGAPGSCNDNNVCTSDVCAAPGTCSNPAAPAGTPCGGGNVCNGAGACVQCSANAQCDDGNACTTDTCAAGSCRRAPVAAGAACGGGNVCSATGVCVQCTTAAQCNDNNACTGDSCSAAGVCSNPNLPSGTACGARGNTCNGTGTCVECTTPAQCNDNNPCTNDTCNMTTATCSRPPLAPGTPCGAGLVCNAAGACVQCASDADCGGGNECNVATCSAAGTCITTPNQALCDDGIDCTVDSCTPTGCAFRPDNALCGPPNECTPPVCSVAEEGCIAEPVEDGTACGSIIGVCQGGVCIGL
jgi:hypothetical protein